MYLNIINNIKYENKRKSKKITVSEVQDESIEQNDEKELIDKSTVASYYSIFYGDLTKNWINLKP